MSEWLLEAKMNVENNNVYKIDYYYTDNHWIDHSVITFKWESHNIRYKKKDLDKVKEIGVSYIMREKKDEWLPFKMWLKNFKIFYR